jgi:uncharacterized protein (TIGR02996 family)
MTDEAFLHAICVDPGDPAPRLVYADWLEERGDPDSLSRAEYLRVACSLDRLPSTDRTRRKLRNLLLQLRKLVGDSWWQQFDWSKFAELYPVVEAPWYEGVPSWPWPVADCKPYSLIRLSDEITEPEVGSVMAQLVSYNQMEAEPTVEALLSGAIAAESLLLPGGVQASDGERQINPGCCCGLEGWREWLDCLRTGQSPWMGHDPTPRIEWADEVVRVWSDGGLGPATDSFAIELDRSQLAFELGEVERELREFLQHVATWARAVGFSQPSALCRKMDACFRITEG